MVFRARTLGFIMRLHNRSTSYHGLIFHLEEHTLNWFWFLWYYVFSSLICRNGSMNDAILMNILNQLAKFISVKLKY